MARDNSGAQTEGRQQGKDRGRSGEDRFWMVFDGFSGFRLGGRIVVLVGFDTFNKPKTTTDRSGDGSEGRDRHIFVR